MKNRKIYEVFASHNVIGVTLEHNGLEDKASFVRLSIENLACTDMCVNGIESKKLELTIKGQSERETLLDALKMIVKELENN